MNEDLLKIFNELLEEWGDAERGVIWEYSTSISKDEEELVERKQNYIERFNKALKENN